MSDRFGLSNIRDGVKKRREELADENNARVRSYDDNSTDEGPFKPFTFQQADFDRTEPDHDAMRKYWRQFETVPFVRKSITSFSRQVMEPGYYIQAQGLDEDQLVKLDHWLSTAAIIGGEPGKDFRQLAKKMVVQQEVRGTAFTELAPSEDDDDKIAGLKLINAETMEAVTKPGQSILLKPEDIEEYDDAPQAESGGAAAWLQDLGETETFFTTPIRGRDRGLNEDDDVDDDFKIGFQRDEIIKMSRDADVGEVFGTSRLEAVSSRIEGLRNKLSDNDDAIASKAYPLWLFMFGSEENPWESDDIDEFMRSHEMENFHAGMKQGVRGDVGVDTVSGEVADIADALHFDIEWIMSIMPIPKYALGAFQEAGSTITQYGGAAQQQEVQRQIKDARRDIEDEFTPVIQRVAEQLGMDEEAVETIRLRVGEPGEPEPENPTNESVIRYIPKDQRNDGADPEDGTTSPGNEGVPDTLPGEETDEEPSEEAGAQLWHHDTGLAQLSVDNDDTLSNVIYSTMVDARDETLESISTEYEDAPVAAATAFENTANGVLRRSMSKETFRDSIKPTVSEMIEGDGITQSNSVKFYTQNIENATEDAIEEMLRLMRTQFRRGVSNNENVSDISQRVKNQYGDAKLRGHAELISHMERKKIEETTKLEKFERDPDVIGIRVSNEDASTQLTQSLHGTEAYFDEGDIQSQLEESTREEFLREGFDPLPTTPPYHFNDTTTLEPIYEQD